MQVRCCEPERACGNERGVRCQGQLPGEGYHPFCTSGAQRNAEHWGDPPRRRRGLPPRRESLTGEPLPDDHFHVVEDAHHRARDAVGGYQFLENLTKLCRVRPPSPEAKRRWAKSRTRALITSTPQFSQFQYWRRRRAFPAGRSKSGSLHTRAAVDLPRAIDSRYKIVEAPSRGADGFGRQAMALVHEVARDC
jgi:hypothetical protein